MAFSEVFPGIAKHADDMAVVRSIFTEHRNHEQAIWMANTGLTVSGRPHIGAWVAFGLGADNQNLPAYVSLPDLGGMPDPDGMPVDGARNWSSGWLPPPAIRELRFAQKECLCCTFSQRHREPLRLITGEWNCCEG